MTNNQLTEAELTETLDAATSGYALTASAEANLRRVFAELQERRKADSEPVAWMATYHGEVSDDAIGITRSIVEAQVERFGWEPALTEITPLYHHAQPAPVVDADDNFYSWFGREWHENYQHNQYTTAAKQMLGVMAESAWKAGRRAAMLQDEPVTTANKLGNSPVIPDTWIPVSERMPENDVSVLTFDGMYKRVHHAMYGHWQCWEPDKITHWMPLPNPPKEEK